MDAGFKVNPRISIHALREESDIRSGYYKNINVIISIHALREESDLWFQNDV